ncbi:MAG: hypothetical protein NTU88_00345 [Armatimonadetes bacterium]|nr:hypothetical protein [Armatimonadota bacterium]
MELAGRYFFRGRGSLHSELREHFGIILAASLTLLGLIIGFSFSMATARYGQRKNYEEAEANAIGTECVRADFLPTADAARLRTPLRDYLDQRVLFYVAHDNSALTRTDRGHRQPAWRYHPRATPDPDQLFSVAASTLKA